MSNRCRYCGGESPRKPAPEPEEDEDAEVATPRGLLPKLRHSLEKTLDYEHIFTYHPARPDQIPKYLAIRLAAMHFARVVESNTPTCADQADAIRKIREAVMTANAAIALDGRISKL